MRGIGAVMGLALAFAMGPVGAACAQTVGGAAQDRVAAIALWRARAEAGDAEAQYQLAQAYRQGNGLAEDPAEAERWYRKAAGQGHRLAQARLGIMLFTSSRRSESFPWLEKAAAQGEPRAQYVVATALFNGDDLPRDWPRAYAMMIRAAAAGLEPAARSLATMERLLPPADRQKGATLAETMATAGRPPSPRRAAAAAPAVVSGWRVQLGAFAREGAARSYWAALAGRAELAGLAPSYVPGAGTTRLQIGPFASRAAADARCAALRQAGTTCFPVAP